MFTTSLKPFNRLLAGNLLLKSLHQPQDAERLIAFNAQRFGAQVGTMSASLIHHHPYARPDYWLYIEDQTTGEIVSSLCLIPWRWRCEEVSLTSAEMGIVSTLENYRNRGLIRALDVRFKELLAENEFDLSHIQGIPYFYRQFGYEYTLPLEAAWQFELRDVPPPPDETAAYRLRPAAPDDIPLLARFYQQATSRLNITTERTPDIWRYLFLHNPGTETETEIMLLLDSQGTPQGYCSLARHGFGTGLIVNETSNLTVTAAGFILDWLKTTAIARAKPYIRFNLPPENDLLRLARAHGAYDNGCYAWQIHIPDAARLLRKFAPLFERRLAASPFAGLTRPIILNLYRTAYALRFEQGKLRAVDSLGYIEEGDIRLPPNTLTPLVLGYRTREELQHIYPDVFISGQSRLLIDVLFPRLQSFIFPNY